MWFTYAHSLTLGTSTVSKVFVACRLVTQVYLLSSEDARSLAERCPLACNMHTHMHNNHARSGDNLDYYFDRRGLAPLLENPSSGSLDEDYIEAF